MPLCNESPINPKADKNYLSIINLMQRRISNKKVANVIVTAFKRCLWYTSKEAVGVSFLDDCISPDKKRKIENITPCPKKQKD